MNLDQFPLIHSGELQVLDNGYLKWIETENYAKIRCVSIFGVSGT